MDVGPTDLAQPIDQSNRLALLKWWLLAIPHYLVVAVFAGGAFAGFNAVNDGDAWGYGLSLIDLLVVIAGIVLLVRGRYPRGIYDLVLGLNRWVFRVAAYASLMTDIYPPFRLDLGRHEPSTQVAPSPIDPKPTPRDRVAAGPRAQTGRAGERSGAAGASLRARRGELRRPAQEQGRTAALGHFPRRARIAGSRGTTSPPADRVPTAWRGHYRYGRTKGGASGERLSRGVQLWPNVGAPPSRLGAGPSDAA